MLIDWKTTVLKSEKVVKKCLEGYISLRKRKCKPLLTGESIYPTLTENTVLHVGSKIFCKVLFQIESHLFLSDSSGWDRLILSLFTPRDIDEQQG